MAVHQTAAFGETLAMEFRFGSYNRFGCSKEADVGQVFFTDLG